MSMSRSRDRDQCIPCPLIIIFIGHIRSCATGILLSVIALTRIRDSAMSRAISRLFRTIVTSSCFTRKLSGMFEWIITGPSRIPYTLKYENITVRKYETTKEKYLTNKDRIFLQRLLESLWNFELNDLLRKGFWFNGAGIFRVEPEKNSFFFDFCGSNFVGCKCLEKFETSQEFR